jgi:hypothetical protein
VRQAVGFGGAAAGQPVTLVARSADVVRLAIANGPTLVLRGRTPAAVCPEQGGTRGDCGGGRGSPSPASKRSLYARCAAAGWTGRLTSTWSATCSQGTGRLRLDAATRWLRGPAGRPSGVHALDALSFERSFKEAGQQPLASCRRPADGGPMLVLVHGTFVESRSTFGSCGPRTATRCAGCSITMPTAYALDHLTLGESPCAMR